MIPPAVGFFHTLAEDAERDLIAGSYGIQFVSLFGTMKIDFAVVIHKDERHSVRIAAVAQYSEHAAWSLPKQGDARFVGHLLFEPPHRAEWGFVVHVVVFVLFLDYEHYL